MCLAAAAAAATHFQPPCQRHTHTFEGELCAHFFVAPSVYTSPSCTYMNIEQAHIILKKAADFYRTLCSCYTE